MQDLKILLNSLGQGHVLKFFDQLSESDQAILLKSADGVDWNQIKKICEEQIINSEICMLKSTSKIDDSIIEPLQRDSLSGASLCETEKVEEYKTVGLKNIAHGKVAALLLSGGQGTRLGVDYPKGMYDVGDPISKSLLQLQAERILEVTELAKQSVGVSKPIFWYIMTSESTIGAIRDFFESNNYFGLPKSNVVFFEQNTIPCIDMNGKVLLEERNKIARSPNGNGGLFEALHENGILDHMTNNGIEYIHVYCVDNILVRVCDPNFLGYCITKDAEAGSKVVEKVTPTESVGIICRVKGKVKVIEYSEVSEKIAHARDEATGKLIYNAGNICDQFFRVDFLKKIKDDKCLPYHLAKKKIAYISLQDGEKKKPTEPNGVKLEKFIFDSFEYTEKFVTWQVNREDEFSPIKNGNKSECDNPETARKSLLRAYGLGILKV